jgi:hypothetical protein
MNKEVSEWPRDMKLVTSELKYKLCLMAMWDVRTEYSSQFFCGDITLSEEPPGCGSLQKSQ